MNDNLLDLLADQFIQLQLIHKGWTFEQFVEAYESGHIGIEVI